MESGGSVILMSNDANHAKRFMEFAKAMDRVSALKQLSELSDKNVNQNYGNKDCWYCNLKDKDKEGGNPRRTIPVNIVESVRELKNPESAWCPPSRAKVPQTWIVCYVYKGLYPDTSKEGWESFQCSHLCTLGECVNPNHLCWESASINQARGKGICSMKCKHQECGQCKCQKIHDPPCVMK